MKREKSDQVATCQEYRERKTVRYINAKTEAFLQRRGEKNASFPICKVDLQQYLFYQVVTRST
jgi:hypothetical protein